MTILKEKSTTLFFILLLLIVFVLVVSSIHDYGASFDEPLIYDYASSIPNIYKRALFSQSDFDYTNIGDLGYYGTSYFIIGEFAQKTLGTFIHTFDVYDRWHVINFLIFLIGVLVLYWLCSKFSSRIPAVIASLLYLTQPLLWGHGIMNPKDTTFAAFFLFTVAAGIKMVDELNNPLNINFRLKFGNFHLFNRWYNKLILIICGIVILDRFNHHMISSPLLHKVFRQILNLPDSSIINNYFLSKAPNFDIFQIDKYVYKFVQQISFFESMFIIFLSIILVLWHFYKSSSSLRWVVIAGAILGLTISTRILGPAAGALVFLYSFLHTKSINFTPYAILYIIAAIIITYISWPFLWADPLVRYFESLRMMAQFPWPGAVLFEGKEILASTLPWNYLPKLIAIQLSVPVIIMGLVGTLYAIFRIIKSKKDKPLLLVALIWFYLPLILWMIFRPNTYDNFRQFLFILPPFFLLASKSISLLLIYLKNKNLQILLSLCLLAPGIVAGVYLHPYEYIYYNGFVGWTSNINNKYESDYWATSFCEAGYYLDPLIGDNTQVAFTNEILSRLTLRCLGNSPEILVEREEISKISPAFSVISTRYGDDRDYYQWMIPIYTIKIGKTELTVIKEAQ